MGGARAAGDPRGSAEEVLVRRLAIAGWIVVAAVPPAQWALERAVPLPIAPSRMGAIAIVLLALAPVAVHVTERLRGRALPALGRAGLAAFGPGLALLALLGAVRLSGGPWGPVPGGPLAGEPAAGALPAWSADEAPRYVALELASGRSLEMLVLRHEGEVFVAANYPERKRWPHELRRDPESVLRVAGRLYPRRAVFVRDPARRRALLEAMNAKYGFDVSLGTGRAWFFRLEPRE